MQSIAWSQIFIWAAILTVAFLCLGLVWRVFKVFIKLWLLFVVLLVVLKLFAVI